MRALQEWFRSRDADSVLDDAVLGCLLDSEVIELCEDFEVSRAEFRRALADALSEGQ